MTVSYWVMDSEGRLVEDKVSPEDYRVIIEEAVEPWSYLKFPDTNLMAPTAFTGLALWLG